LENAYSATGKRKRAIASVILKAGKGERLVNGRHIKDYVMSDVLVTDIEKPLDLLQIGQSYDIIARVRGGGISGQAGALRLGISRALAKINDEYKRSLRKDGLLTRDARVVERKKYGLAGARKRFQFSKR
jgi:small subunit ribosomal protein S9